MVSLLLKVGLAASIGISSLSYYLLPVANVIRKESVEFREYEHFSEYEKKTYEFKRVFKDPCQEKHNQTDSLSTTNKININTNKIHIHTNRPNIFDGFKYKFSLGDGIA